MAVIQTKFKRLKENAGFLFSPSAMVLCKKESKNKFRVLGENSRVEHIDKNYLVWVDSFQVKRWWQW